ncbi:MAG: hypothetical protein NC311_13750, partial [Muribaculaceae bacterium]|nr:hypothetical protein [Muribaculaceae bacterium]
MQTIYRIKQRETVLKPKVQQEHTPKELAKQKWIDAHEKAAKQVAEMVKIEATGPKDASSERQGEDDAKQTVYRTAVTSAQSTKSAGQVITKSVRLMKELPKNIRQEATVDIVSTPYYASKAKSFDSNFAPDRSTPETRGRELARTRAKQRTDRLREQRAATRIREMDLRSGTGLPGEHLPLPNTA